MKKKDEESACITQCYISKYSAKKHKFYEEHLILADINTKGTEWKGKPTIFNRVFINCEGIFYLQKN